MVLNENELFSVCKRVLKMEIMFDDLSYEAQQRLLEEAGVATPEEMDWDTEPLVVLNFDKEEEAIENGFIDEEVEEDFDFDDEEDPYY